MSPLGFADNAELVEEAGAPVPDSWMTFADPAYRQNIALAHAAASGNHSKW